MSIVRGASERKVSIHAPREGRDGSPSTASTVSQPFQFTHPGRGATSQGDHSCLYGMFQFTHPGRGATAVCGTSDEDGRVSIHAPREGRDGA